MYDAKFVVGVEHGQVQEGKSWVLKVGERKGYL
jgi:hypothetical protein